MLSESMLKWPMSGKWVRLERQLLDLESRGLRVESGELIKDQSSATLISTDGAYKALSRLLFRALCLNSMGLV